MKIIFVRHGLTAANVSDIHQTSEESLSAEGFRQARIVARRLKGVKAGRIVSSRCVRAMQTAQEISKTTGLRVSYTNLLDEIRNPSEVYGKKHGSRFVAPIWREINAHADDPKWHYSDEENIFDVRNRAVKAIRYLKSRKEGTLIVVTHGIIMRMILFVGIFGKDAQVLDLFNKFTKNLSMKNTGITECEIGRKGFRLITFNDHAHLK